MLVAREVDYDDIYQEAYGKALEVLNKIYDSGDVSDFMNLLENQNFYGTPTMDDVMDWIIGESDFIFEELGIQDEDAEDTEDDEDERNAWMNGFLD